MKILKSNHKNVYKTAIKAIKDGKVLICPTDTVYGLICDATNKKAVEKLFKIKKRPLKKPIPIFAKDLKMAKDLVVIGKKEENFLKKVWPGQVTIILKRKKKTKLFGVDKETIALRIPDYRLINLLLKRINRSLTGTSANLSGKPASGKIKETVSQFKNQKYQPDLVLDAGSLPKRLPSTIIDLTGRKIKIIREGSIKILNL